jgi:two-component system, LytTR family, sensor kinase
MDNLRKRIKWIFLNLEKYKVHHILFWLLYYMFWIFTYRSMYQDFLLLMKVTMVYTISHATLYYSSQYYLNPRFLKRNKFFQFLASFLILCCLLSLLMFILISMLMGKPAEELFRSFFITDIVCILFFQLFCRRNYACNKRIF